MGRRIPVLVVAGFLGAGKTTLLNHLLRNNRGIRIGVVVNDFGAVNIDAMLVAGQVDAMVSLGNGCVCCAVDVDELDALFDQLAQPKAKIDVIVVESSGLAEPRNLIRMIVNSENRRITYGGLIELVDAEHFAQSRAQHPELVAHLRMADLVVVNKADRVTPEALRALRDEIGAIADPAPVYATTQGRIDPGLLFDAPHRKARKPGVGEQLSFDELLYAELDADEHGSHADCDGHDDSDAHGHHDAHCGHRHLHDDYESLSFTSDTDLDPRALIAVFEDPPPGLFRAKGTLAFATPDDQRKFVLHLVGRHIVVEPVPWPRHEPRASNLVLIGAGLDTEIALERLRATVHTDPEPLDDQELLPVWRYVEAAAQPLDDVRG